MSGVDFLLVLVKLVLVSESTLLATALTDCFSLDVYEGSSELTAVKSVIILKPETNLTFSVQVKSPNVSVRSEGETESLSLQLSSLGVQPVVSVVQAQTTDSNDGDAEFDVQWNTESSTWLVSSAMSTLITCSPRCPVVIHLSSQVDNVCVTQWEGEVLNASEVPVLVWLFQLESISSSFDNVSDEQVFSHVAHLQCHPDVSVAVRGQHLLFTLNLYGDASSTKEYNICDLASLSETQCTGMVVEDIALTYSRLLILTSSGLLVSIDAEDGSPTTQPLLVFLQSPPFLSQGAHFLEAESLICQYPVLSQEAVMVSAPSHASIFSSHPPYEEWSEVVCSSGCGVGGARLVTYDTQRGTYIMAQTDDDMTQSTTVYVIQSNGVKSSSFNLSGNITLTGIHYHSTTASVYLTGSEVWMSVDGGYTFEHLLSLAANESVTDFSLSEQAIAFITNSGRLFSGRPASRRVMETQLDAEMQLNMSRVVFDSSGQLYSLQMDSYQNIQSVRLLLTSDLECDVTALPINHHLVFMLRNNTTPLHLHGDAMVGMVATSSESPAGRGVVVSSLGERGWGMVVQSLDHVTSGWWRFHEEQCWIQLNAEQTLHQQSLDIGDHLQLQVESFLADVANKVIGSPELIPRHMWDISIIFGRPDLFDISTTIDRHYLRQRVTVDVWQRDTAPPTPFYSTVTFHLIHCPLVCERCSLTAIISSSCPTNKQLVFIYPTTQSEDQLYHLPVNYRPPSEMGVAISTSPHVYNADPLSPMMNSQFSESSMVAQYKQCDGANLMSTCQCSPDMETSMDIAHSDCIRKVYRHLYESDFTMTFALVLGDGSETAVNHSILIEEINNRTDFRLSQNQDNSSVITPGGSQALSLTGPGLYHFKATLLDVQSFCSLTTQFIVYVDRTPLTKAGEQTITILTTVFFGVGALVIYLVYNMRHHHK